MLRKLRQRRRAGWFVGRVRKRLKDRPNGSARLTFRALTSLAVVRARGFAPAGKRLGIAKSAASRRVNDLEDRLTLDAPQAAATAALSGAAQQRSLH